LGNRTLDRRTWRSALWSVEAGCGTLIWGQTRCPICRSRTFNVKRSTLNFQRGDRKGARWAGYGDRHGAWATGLLTAGPGRAPGGRSRPAAAPGYGDRHGVRTDQERLTSNVQLSTFNGVTEMAHGGRDMGTDTVLGRPDSWPPDLAERQVVGQGRLRHPDMGTDTMSDIPIRNV